MGACSDVDFGFEVIVGWERRVMEEAEGAWGWFWTVAVGEPFLAFGFGIDLGKSVGEKVGEREE